ncbi:zinc ribbon domain-containing protein [Nitrosomonas sp.]|uniref:zinc ribbon domain-containing protein n=1 Tax=Nitrosomonas sp. TaxID=42353 RepID=UPI00262124FF|nr:zinc ribbon domain-containing protein [Nitrosomonas sp.]
MNGQAKAPVRKDINEDFPLRGFVTCACCGSPLTVCWTRGRGGLYAYYLCYGKASGVKNVANTVNPFARTSWKANSGRF